MKLPPIKPVTTMANSIKKSKLRKRQEILSMDMEVMLRV
jgi:hypothetical protein